MTESVAPNAQPDGWATALALPEFASRFLFVVAVVTSSNYRLRDAHQLTECILTEYVLAAVEI
jgi:hypothetical protein